MLLSVAEFARDASMCPELAGSRVLITGVGSQSGVDLVRAFGDHGCRLILQIPDPCAETDALLEIVAEAALEVRVHHDDIGEPAEAVKFTQASTKAYGALDVVVNVISFDAAAFEGLESFEAIEDEVVAQMQSAARITQVAANRMGLM